PDPSPPPGSPADERAALATADGTAPTVDAPPTDDTLRTAARPTAATADELTLQVRGSDGALLAGAVVHCGPGGQSSQHGITDRDGRLRVDGWSTAGEVWVWARERAPFRQQLPELRGAHEIVLPDEPVLEGLVTVDGMPPGEPIVLSVHWREDAERPAMP